MTSFRSPGRPDANVQQFWADLMIEELVRNGVDTFYVAPGSRSTPLTVAAARHADTTVELHVDERGNAFAALGFGRATRRPAGWITTSGTAVANGYPAVVESSVDGVPLILLTADRPPELRDTGANQTIDQVKFFGDYVRWQADIPPPTDEVDPAYVLTTVDQAVHRASRSPAGPVQLNCAFRKPLEPKDRGDKVAVPDAVAQWSEEKAPFTTYPNSTSEASESSVQSLAAAVADATAGLVVVGRLDTAQEARAVCRLAERLEWPLVPDLTSHLRLGRSEYEGRIAYGDLLLCSEDFRAERAPDVVLQIGGRFTSKRLRHFLRDSEPAIWAVVRPDPSRVDPDHRITHHIESSVASFTEDLLDHVETGSMSGASPLSVWRQADARAEGVVRDHVEAGTMTEPSIATVLTQEVPSSHALVAGSSMPIRDLNRHAAPDGERVPAYANRGASGIDGTLATAAGVARGHGCPVTVLLGDVALWHDLNSLALFRDAPVVAVVVNNDGGGIFHFLPIREHEDIFEPYFTTPHGRSFAAAADTFGLAYAQPANLADFREAYLDACAADGSTLIEVRTERDENRRVHEQLERAVSRAIKDSG